MKGFFITGTGTEVGKTVVSMAVIGALRSMGLDVCGMKPVESGCDDIAADGSALLGASGVDEPMELITPFVFRAPLAPLDAARLEGRKVDSVAILATARELASRHEALVVEGAGGFMVPIAEDGYLVRDMACDFGLPVIVVANTYLGTVNHTLLTVEAIERSGLMLAGVVLNSTSPIVDGAVVDSSRRLIEEGSGMPLLGELPFIEGAIAEGAQAAGEIVLNKDMLGKYL